MDARNILALYFQSHGYGDDRLKPEKIFRHGRLLLYSNVYVVCTNRYV